MGKAATRAKNKYNAKAYDRISVMVPKGEKEKIKQAAEKEGTSLNGYAYRAIMRRMQEGRHAEG